MRLRILLAAALLCSAACKKEAASNDKQTGDGAPACPPDPEYPNHPGCIMFVFPDGHSEIRPVHEAPNKFIDGKPVVKIDHTGQCILEFGPNDELLRSTHLAYTEPTRSASAPLEPEKPTPPGSSRDPFRKPQNEVQKPGKINR